MKKIAVLSKYKEKNDFFERFISENGYEIIVFNKSQGENLLPNVGKEGHTYLHYIIENYNNLPDEILFSQYDPLDHFRGAKGSNIAENITDFLSKNLIDFCGIRATDFDLIVRGREINWIGFSKELFGNFEDQDISSLVAHGSTLNGIFRVTKEAILRNNISLYEQALKMLSNGWDPYEGYFFERIWKFLFIEVGCKDQPLKELEEKIFLFGTTNKDGLKIPKYVSWKQNSYGHIKLSSDGTITSNGNVSYYHNFNESHWLIRNNTLYFLNACGACTSKFQLGNLYENFKDGKSVFLLGDMSLGFESWQNNGLILRKAFWQDHKFSPIN
jgi:hypothetical protein